MNTEDRCHRMRMGWRLRAFVACALAAGLSACASTQPRQYFSYGAEDNADTTEPDAYLAGLAEDVQRLSCEARRESGVLSAQCLAKLDALEVGSPAQAINAYLHREIGVGSPSKASQFLQAGMALTDLLCMDHFNRTLSSHQHREYARSVLNGANGLVSTIMGLTNAGSLPTGIVGASFSFAGSAARDIETNYMVSVDLASAQAMVQRALAVQAHHHTLHPPTNYYVAERALVRYATTCTFTGVRALLSQSVRASELTVKVNGREAVVEVTTRSDQQTNSDDSNPGERK